LCAFRNGELTEAGKKEKKNKVLTFSLKKLKKDIKHNAQRAFERRKSSPNQQKLRAETKNNVIDLV